MKSRLADLTSLSGLRKNIGVSGIIKSIPSLISSKISLFNFGKGQTKNV